MPIGGILSFLAGKCFEDTRKKGIGAKTGASHDWRSFYLSQYDWLKGSHMAKVVWLPNETDYSYCEFVAQIPPYFCRNPMKQVPKYIKFSRLYRFLKCSVTRVFHSSSRWLGLF